MAAEQISGSQVEGNGAAGDDEDEPAGFVTVTSDLAGYWEAASQGSAKTDPSEGSPPVYFVPLHATLSDNKREPEKSSTLIHARLTKPCKLKSAVKEEGYKEFPAGTLFGIWAKPGMRKLEELGGVECWMRNGQKNPATGEIQRFKDIGKGSDMVLFTIKGKQEKGEKLKVLDDRRDKSLPERLRAKRAADVTATDDIPF